MRSVAVFGDEDTTIAGIETFFDRLLAEIKAVLLHA